MIRRLILVIAALAGMAGMAAGPAFAQYAPVYGFCTAGTTSVTLSGLTAAPQVQGSYPGCTVTVNLDGGGGAATIYSNATGTPLGNPFTASSTTGYWQFYASPGTALDVTISGGGLPSPFTYSYLIPAPLFNGSYTWSGLQIFNGGITTASANTLGGTLSITATGTTGSLTAGSGLLGGNNGWTGNETHSGTEGFSGPLNATGGLTACINNTVRYIDPTNACGWYGSDLAAWWNAAIASLPTDSNGYPYGTILLGSGSYTISSGTANDHSPHASVEGTGPGAVVITCTYNGDCINTQVDPYWIGPGRSIGGFTLLGDNTAVANGVGIHAGDSVGTKFHDITIDDFNGTNGACWRLDNLNGSFERNIFLNDEIGIEPNGGQAGCTKLIRVTNSGGVSNTSFEYDTYVGLRMSVESGNIGWSVEGTTNAPSFIGDFIQGSSNTVGNNTPLFDFSGDTSFASGQIFWTTECDNCTTGNAIWTIPSGASVHYRGDVIAYGAGSNSVSGSLVNEGVQDNTVTGTSFPVPISVAGAVTATGNGNFSGQLNVGGVLNINGNTVTPLSTLTIAGGVSATNIQTASNCSSSASPAVCGSAAAGAFNIAASSSTVVVDTSAVTASSDIQITFNSALGTRLGVTCNTTAQQPYVTGILAGTSFTVSVPSTFSSNPGCFTYQIFN